MRVPNAIGVRWRHPLLRPVRFGAVGAACSGVQLAVLLALQRVHYLVAALCGIAVAAPVNYLIEHYLVFRPRPAPGQGLGPV